MSAYFTNVRVVCQNTLNASLGLSKNKHTVRQHTVTAKDRLTEALIIMGVMQRNSDLDKQAYQQMKAQQFTDKMFSHYLGNVFFTPHEIAELKKGDTGVISTRKGNVIAEVVNFAHTGIGQDLAGGGQVFGLIMRLQVIFQIRRFTKTLNLEWIISFGERMLT